MNTKRFFQFYFIGLIIIAPTILALVNGAIQLYHLMTESFSVGLMVAVFLMYVVVAILIIIVAVKHILGLGKCVKFNTMRRCDILVECPECRTYRLSMFIWSMVLLLPLPAIIIDWSIMSQDLGTPMGGGVDTLNLNVIRSGSLDILTSPIFVIAVAVMVIINIGIVFYRTRKLFYSLRNCFVQMVVVYLVCIGLMVAILFLQALIMVVVFILFFVVLVFKFFFGARRD